MNEKKAASKITLNGSYYMNREVQTQFAFKVYPSDKKEILRLRRVSGLTWPTFVKYVNRLVKEDLDRKASSELNKIIREEKHDFKGN